MPKRSRKPPDKDYQEIAHDVFAKVLEKSEGTIAPPPAPEPQPPAALTKEQIADVMRDMGRRGGQKGGPARAAKLTKEQRSASARKAAEARWKQAKKPE